ncbi:MAG: hypothetical protein FJ279_25730, partial [Planctomycetes bacterium]|nr:hypothetical protein [Planctomycetota bacterium]
MTSDQSACPAVSSVSTDSQGHEWARRLVPVALLLAAEVVVAPLMGMCLSGLPRRCRTPAEGLLVLGLFARAERTGTGAGTAGDDRARLDAWYRAVRLVRGHVGLTALYTCVVVVLLSALVLWEPTIARIPVSLWCLVGACFFAANLLALPLDKELMPRGALRAAMTGGLYGAGLMLYAAAALALFPLSRRQWSALLKSVAIFLAVFFVYTVNIRELGSGDCVAAPYVTLSLLREGDFDLDEFPWARGDLPWVDRQSYGIVQDGGRVLSMYPALTSVLASPLFAVFFLAPWYGIPDNGFLLLQVGKLAATVFAALSAVLVYLTVRRVAPRWAIAVTCLYSFGTGIWFVSQALWQHPGCAMALAVAVCSLSRAVRDPRFVALAGFALALAVAARYACIAIVVVLAAYAVWRHREHWQRLVLGALPVVLFQLSYNWRYFGSPFAASYPAEAWHGWRNPLAVGLVGNLIGPSRGLLVLSP